MKRIALVLTIAASLLIAPATFGAVKTGATCTKLGSTSFLSGKKFTCIKSGKKLIWDKGVVVNKPAIVVPEAPKLESISSPTPLPSSTAKTNQSARTLLGNYEIPSRIYAEISQELFLRKSSGIEPELFISPNFNKKFIDISMLGIYKAMDYWSDIFKPKYKMPIFFVNPSDTVWFNETFPKRIDNVTFLNHFNKIYSFITSNWGSGDADSDIKTQQNFIVYVYTNDYKPNFGSSQIGSHEYTHSMQHAFNIWNNNEQFPCWVKEGQAMFFGMILSQPTLIDYLEVRYKFYQNTSEAQTTLPQNSPNWVTFFQNAEENKLMCANNGVYEAGAMAFEYLFSLRGKKGMIELLNAIEIEDSFEKALQKTYGKNKNDLYRDFGNYIESQLTELRKNN